jgi:hypothetical protein
LERGWSKGRALRSSSSGQKIVSIRPGLSTVERDLSQFEALKKAVLTEAEGRKPCGERFLAHSRRGFCVQYRHTDFLIAKASRVFRSLSYPLRLP